MTTRSKGAQSRREPEKQWRSITPRFPTLHGWALVVLLVAAVAISLLARFYEPLPGDISLILWVQSWRHPIVTTFMQAMALIGRSWLLIGLAAATVAALFVADRRRECLAAAGALVILCLTPILQILVDRARPPADLVGLNDPFGGLGFPSGHAYQSFVLFAFLIHLASMLVHRTWLRRSFQAFMAFLILAIGISRVYLGAHWPSDVLGAYLLGGSFLALLLQGYQTNVPTAASR
jgi:undecaprenyl-diphosphatase